MTNDECCGDRYLALVAAVDGIAANLSQYYSRHLVCRAGCSSCCGHNLTVFPVEAAAVREAIRQLGPEVREAIRLQALDTREREGKGAPASCPMLVDDCCAIYGSRPVICRTQGLPLLFTAEDGRSEVDFCPLNFAAGGATDDLDEGHLVQLDSLNRDLVRANLEYTHSLGLAPSAYRVSMSDIILGGTAGGRSQIGTELH